MNRATVGVALCRPKACPTDMAPERKSYPKCLHPACVAYYNLQARDIVRSVAFIIVVRVKVLV